ncbi:hypothetical protein HanXRQr2_Chr16g0752001 [Helianthus annuus]|uniref:Uncharacterized protein n=1 Tax=Helianthus annuus TaxID=4232 RepID=A0A9K3DTW9_HELAN|nr:hypothetical protein HanXRQr2_Chr16g0752001 [Helianthus annuus]
MICTKEKLRCLAKLTPLSLIWNPFDVPSSHAYYVGTWDELKPRRTRLFHVQNSNRYHLYLALAIAFHNCSLSS